MYSDLLLALPNVLGFANFAAVVIGVYSIHGRMFDVYLMLGFGAIGWVMDKLKFPLPPVVLGACATWDLSWHVF